MNIFEILFLIVIIGFALYILFHFISAVINFIKWLRMSPKEREKLKKLKRRSNYASNSDSSDSIWDFFSSSSDGGSDGGGGDGGGGGD